MKLRFDRALAGRVSRATALIAAALLMLVTAAPSAADEHIREVVAFSSNQFPEGLTVAPDGTVLVGILSTAEIVRVTPAGTSSVYAKLPLPAGGIMAGLNAVDSTNLYALAFSQNETNGVWYVANAGRNITQVAKLPVGSLPNDLVRDSAGRLYVTDTIGGRVFRVEPNGRVETWAQHPLLQGNVAQPGPVGFPIGANGIAFSTSRDSIYVSVSEGARIVRIPIRADDSAGPPVVLAEHPALAAADGIEIGPRGLIYVAVNAQNHIATVDPVTGRVEVVASGAPLRFPASVRFSPDFQRLYVTNFDGAIFFGLAPGPPKTGLLVIDVASLGARPPQSAVQQPSAGAQPAGQQTGTIAPPRTGSGGLVR
jgi:sugar lactone lactonase YvrE